MAKTRDTNDAAGVTLYIKNLKPNFAQLVETIRQLILGADPSVGEQIKWNSPSFFYLGEMKPFNAREYSRDIVVMNLRNDKVLLIFPTGAKLKDTTGILEGNYTDGRRMCMFETSGDVQLKGKQLQQLIRQWLSMVDK